MEENFVEIDICISKLLIHYDEVTSPGLFYGLMGEAIVLARLSKYVERPWLEEAADFILDKSLKQAEYIKNISFASGLCGICWGLEYLTQNGYLKQTTDEICSELDQYIESYKIVDIEDFSIENGLYGIYLYIMARLIGNAKAELRHPFSSGYLRDWKRILEKHQCFFPKASLKAFTDVLSGKLYYDIPDVSSFIHPIEFLNKNKMGLRDGFAGYIELKFL